jgi:hypothetical protein
MIRTFSAVNPGALVISDNFKSLSLSIAVAGFLGLITTYSEKSRRWSMLGTHASPEDVPSTVPLELENPRKELR